MSIQYQRKELKEHSWSYTELKNDSDQLKLNIYRVRIEPKLRYSILIGQWSRRLRVFRPDGEMSVVVYAIFVTTIIIITQLSVHAQVNITGVLKIVTGQVRPGSG